MCGRVGRHSAGGVRDLQAFCLSELVMWFGKDDLFTILANISQVVELIPLFLMIFS